jgi:hypothetical protein
MDRQRKNKKVGRAKSGMPAASQMPCDGNPAITINIASRTN